MEVAERSLGRGWEETVLVRRGQDYKPCRCSVLFTWGGVFSSRDLALITLDLCARDEDQDR